MGLVSLLFSFRGRINRLQYWVGSLAVGVGSALLIFMLAVIAGVGVPMDKHAGLQGGVAVILIIGIVGLVSGWCGLALQTKRFHDRGQPGWLSALPLLPAFGIVTAIAGGAASGQSPAQVFAAVQPYVLALWAINFFFFINLGCLAGADGPNKYGPPNGGPRSPSFDPAPQPRAPAPISFGGVEAAMERAIAEQACQPHVREPATLRPQPALAASTGGGASFGRRPAR